MRRSYPVLGPRCGVLGRVIAFSLVALAPTGGARASIDTTPFWDGSNFISSWGLPNTATYGQTFTASDLQWQARSFTFYLQLRSATEIPQYRAYVYEWDSVNQHVTSTALFVSDVMTAPNSGEFTAVTINTGRTVLTPGKQYVVLLTTSSVAQVGTSEYRWGSVADAAYAGGNFVFNNNMTDFDALGTTPWNAIAGDLAFTARFIPNIPVIVQSQGNTPALGAAAVLGGLWDGGASADMQTVLDAFCNLTTEQQVSSAVSQTLPLLYGGMSLATLDVMHDLNRVVETRQDGTRAWTSGDETTRNAIWIKPFGSWARQSSRGRVPGFTFDGFGVAVGADHSFAENDRVGLALAMGTIDLDGKDSEGKHEGTIRTKQLIFYGSHSFDGRADLDWQVDVGNASNEGTRTIDFGGLYRIARADYRSQFEHVGLRLSRTFAKSERAEFSPYAKVDYARVHSNDYSERNAGALNLDVQADTMQELIPSVGGKARVKMSNRTSLTVDLGVGYDLKHDRATLDAAYEGGGAAFTTRGLEPSSFLYKVGLGLSVIDSRTAFELRYDIEGRSSFTNQAVSLLYRVDF